MKLFSKEVNLKLFKQYPKGGDLQNQVVVTKIFNPYGAGRWYLINSDPDDPDYIWAIVQMGSTVEVGSVSRNQLESIRIKPFNLPLERDLYFDPVNASELFKGLSEGKFYKAGGWTEGSENKAMLLNQAEGFEHHAEELESAVKKSDHIPAWVVAKSERASTDLSDITHYLDGENEQKREMVEGEEEEEEYAEGGEVKWEEAAYGDNALVVSENKMGMIIKPYGRKFHLKFVDGTEKTYDASELKFFKDMDDFDMGGEVHEDEEDLFENYDKIPKNVQKVLDKYSDAFEDGDYKGLEKANKELEKIGYTFEYGLDGQAYDLRKIGKKGKSESYKEGGDVKVGDKVKSKSGVEGEVYESTGMFFKLKDKYGNKNPKLFSVRDFKPSEIKSMAEGGNVKKQEWVAVYVNQEKPSERKIIQAFGNTKEEATKNARMSEGYYGIKKPLELTEIYTYSGNLPMMAEGGMMEKGGKTKKEYKFGDKVIYAPNGKFFGAKNVSYIKKAEITDVEEVLGKKVYTLEFKNKFGQTVNTLQTDNSKEIDLDPDVKMASGGMTDPMATVNEIARLSGLRPVAVAEWGDKNNVNLSILLKDLKSKKIKGMDLTSAIVGNPNNEYQKELLSKYSRTKMAEGGKVKFADKVASVKASLLKRKKVPKAVQKDYGKTFSPAEAEDSAKRIVGAMTAKERLMAKKKKKYAHGGTTKNDELNKLNSWEKENLDYIKKKLDDLGYKENNPINKEWTKYLKYVTTLVSKLIKSGLTSNGKYEPKYSFKINKDGDVRAYVLLPMNLIFDDSKNEQEWKDNKNKYENKTQYVAYKIGELTNPILGFHLSRENSYENLGSYVGGNI